MTSHIILYHGTSIPKGEEERLKDFLALDITSFDQGFHVGTLAQARMRGGRNIILSYLLRGTERPVRVRDQISSWKRTCARHRSKNTGLLTYLNRYEGLPVSRTVAMAEDGRHDFDALPDARFRKLVPEAEDSHVVLAPGFLTFHGVVQV